MNRCIVPVLLLGAALRAGADDTSARPGPWTYRPGQTYEYEAKTEFEYSNGSYEATYKNPCGGPDLKHTVEKLTHQSETVQLKATVTAVGDDGAARLTFEVLGAQVEARDGDSGMNATWDSRGKALPPAGYLRWASMIGHKFDAVVGADGSVRELKDKDWPSDATKSADVPKGETKASKDHLDPTSKQAWLELIFATAPRERAWVNEFHLPIPEKMDFAPDGREAVGAETCARVKFDTQEHPANAADAMPKERHKRGQAWWSLAGGCTVKVELHGVEEAKLYKPGLFGRVTWTATLRKRGSVDLSPASEADAKSGGR